MQSITQYLSDQASYTTAMSISLESSITSTHSNSLTLPRLLHLSPIPSTRTFESPTPKKLTFSTTEYIEPVQLCPIKMEDLDSKDGSPLVLPTTDLAAPSALKRSQSRSSASSKSTTLKRPRPSSILLSLTPTPPPTLTPPPRYSQLMNIGTPSHM